jgi:uncharacterized protein (DUF1919 family)
MGEPTAAGQHSERDETSVCKTRTGKKVAFPRAVVRCYPQLVRWLIGDTKFSIISNNCWGAHVYQALHLPYQTPFVGMFIPPKSYIQLLWNFEDCIGSSLKFVNQSESASLNSWRQEAQLTYPIGVLGGRVEVHFLHYATMAEVESKWRRRCARIVTNRQRLFVKFDDRDGATSDDIEAFFQTPYDNKVCFSGRFVGQQTILVPADSGTRHAVDGVVLGEVSYQYFNTLRWLSTRPAWVRLPSLL